MYASCNVHGASAVIVQGCVHVASSYGSGLHFASASVWGLGASASVVSGHEYQCCAIWVSEWVLAHHLPPSSLSLLPLGLPQRPQRCTGWVRGKGGRCQGAPLSQSEIRVGCTKGLGTCVHVCVCG